MKKECKINDISEIIIANVIHFTKDDECEVYITDIDSFVEYLEKNCKSYRRKQLFWLSRIKNDWVRFDEGKADEDGILAVCCKNFSMLGEYLTVEKIGMEKVGEVFVSEPCKKFIAETLKKADVSSLIVGNIDGHSLQPCAIQPL